MALPCSQTFLLAKLKATLHQALAPIGALIQSALLLYPDHPNIGDHLIGLGEIAYLGKVVGAAVNYIMTDYCQLLFGIDRATRDQIKNNIIYYLGYSINQGKSFFLTGNCISGNQKKNFNPILN